MLFGLFTLFVALVIEAVGAYYSVSGLAAIFSGALIPILIMGAALEVGKVTAAVWLKLNWDRASITYKLYLVPAVAFLMLLTSMGIFGFLSKAHSDQSLVSGDSMAKVAIYDEKISTSKDNIAMARKALKQMDDAVDQVMGRSDDEKGADKAVAIRRGQSKERARLLAEIESEQRNVAKLSEERAPLAAEFRKVESEVGPIKYIAALLYGDNPDANILERAVRWVIILIVAVFDPLALVLILAAQQTLRWNKEDKTQTREFDEFGLPEPIETPPMPPVVETAELDPVEDLTEVNHQLAEAAVVEEPYIEQPYVEQEEVKEDPHKIGWMYEGVPHGSFDVPEEPKTILETHPYLTKPFVHFSNTTPIVATVEKPEIYSGNPDDFKKEWSDEEKARLVTAMGSFYEQNKEVNEVTEVKAEIIPDADPVEIPEEPKILAMGVDVVERPGDYITPPEDTTPSKFPTVPATAKRFKAEQEPVPETLNVRRATGLHADNVEGIETNSSFGTKFPDTANKGDTFLRVDYLPNRLFKFNGIKWIEVDKTNSASYAYDEQYILFLIEKLQTGEYEIDQLSASEQELVAEKLQQIANDKT